MIFTWSSLEKPRTSGMHWLRLAGTPQGLRSLADTEQHVLGHCIYHGAMLFYIFSMLFSLHLHHTGYIQHMFCMIFLQCPTQVLWGHSGNCCLSWSCEARPVIWAAKMLKKGWWGPAQQYLAGLGFQLAYSDHILIYFGYILVHDEWIQNNIGIYWNYNASIMKS